MRSKMETHADEAGKRFAIFGGRRSGSSRRRRRSASLLRFCATKTASLSCAARKASTRISCPCLEKSSLDSSLEKCKSDLVVEALELSAAAAL